jgi:3-dehydroquinate dehydratase/shikimate dehydrogenase
MTNQKPKVCVPVCVREVRDLHEAIALACAHSDLIELRFDCLEPSQLSQALEQTRALISTLDRPVIVTFRPAEQGGKRALDQASRLRFQLSEKPTGAAFSDIELDLVLALAAQDSSPHYDNWAGVICSHHDFNGVPENLDQIYEQLASTPAAVLKIAVHAADITDCLPVFQLLERAQRDGRELIAIAMGAAGVATRILGPARGSFLTYGALATERGTAPGQLTARELREVYRIDQIDRQTQVTGLIGLPVGHSVSPQLQNAALAATNSNAVYLPLEVHDVSAFMQRMVNPRTRELDWRLRGLSVTAPHKLAVMEHLDWIEPAAREIGAVNTIVVAEGSLLGYNTDALAVLQPAIEKLGPLQDARCAVIGAGGAASAALWSLRQQGAMTTLFARNEVKGRALAVQFGVHCESLAGAQWTGFDLVINATPLGTSGPLAGSTPATADQLRGARLAYDLVYNPNETRFMSEARAAGCNAIGGLAMLVLQAAEQFRLWMGSEPPIDIMREAARRALGA